MSVVTTGGPSIIRDANYYEVPEGEHIFSWSPDPEPGRSPATQVHLHSPRTLSVLIHALREHRDYVWPKVCEVCDGAGVLDQDLKLGEGEAARCKDCGGTGTR